MSAWLLRGNAPIRRLNGPASKLRLPLAATRQQPCRTLSSSPYALRRDGDPRIRDLGREISDDFATVRDTYATPRYPIVLAHGLLGFSELQLTRYLPAVQYWYGIKDALTAQGATVLCASVPPSSSIEDRAAKLRDDIDASTRTTDGSRAEKVNIIAHSMGGLDARYMIRHLPPRTAEIASLVTVSTPHRGSHFADAVLDEDAANGPLYLPRLYGLLERAGLDTAAFAQLTRAYMTGTFNPATPDRDSVQYFSYGARCDEPPLLSPFRRSWQLVRDAEGANDGLVSVESSQWGAYRGTLVGVSHLDLINWSNRVRWTLREWMGMKRNFNAIAFYLDIADMLAKEGL